MPMRLASRAGLGVVEIHFHLRFARQAAEFVQAVEQFHLVVERSRRKPSLGIRLCPSIK